MNWRALALLVIAANCIYWAWNTWIVVPSQRFTDHSFKADTPELVIVPEQRTAPRLERVTQLSSNTSTSSTNADASSETATDVDNLSTETPGNPIDVALQNISACHRVGYFVNRAEADAASAWLNIEGIETTSKTAKQNVFAGYWVHLPAYPNQAAAAQVVTALQDKNIKDLFVETRAPNQNAISLGLFRQRTGAEQRLKQIQALGFPAKIINREPEQTVYWLEFELENNRQIPLARIPVAEGQVRRLERQDCASG